MARPIIGLLGNIYISQVPFAKPIGFLPQNGGVAIPNANSAIPTVNGANGLPLGTDLSGTSFTGDPNDGLGLGFGTVTIIDDILTSSPELGSQTIGKAQGFYMASSEMDQSQLSVTGGTGKFKNANGIAELKRQISPGQRATDGA
ncbi:dirigent protein 16-like [Pyrus ussuriensis x Pyrus communis]|uniref:Dirigent protein n=1 Tax=Pyrus ussuriensis x Pyrus communis TaxID=2448454 RepID=A0A5N5HCQ8_9ROSA|nr:dirigent protein 16-like [Pyrus ussuriensis x Pyrus communis]